MKARTEKSPLSGEELKNEAGKKAEKTAEKTAGTIRTDQTHSLSQKIRNKKPSVEAEGAKLRFGKKEIPVERKSPAALKQQRIMKGALFSAAAKAHQEVSKNEDGNVGVQAANETGSTAETVSQMVSHARYSRKRKASLRAEKLETKTGWGRAGADRPQAGNHSFSRWQQRQAIKKEYAARKAGKHSAGTAAGPSIRRWGRLSDVGRAVKPARKGMTAAANYVRKHRHILLLVGVLAIIILMAGGMLSSCAMFLGSTENAILSTSYTAEEEDIRGADEDYSAMEEALRERLRQIEEDNPGYDEYEMDLSEIGHDPYELAAFLTVLFEDYTRDEVQDTLREIFEAQYEYQVRERTETETETRQVGIGESLGSVVTSGYCSCPICCGIWSGGPTASGVYPTADHTLAVDARHPFVPIGTKVVMNGVEYTVEDTGNFDRYGVQFDVYYDSHWAATLHGHQTWEAWLSDRNGRPVEVTQTVTKRILTVEITNHGLESVVEHWGLSDEQLERYHLLVELKGNREDLFADQASLMSQETAYHVPGHALTNERFARMVQEAEKYLGYPYVWGGSTPSTSFDCSGFVCWVINHSGNGWNVGRTTAEGLHQMLPVISPEEARPGDIILFQGTYRTAGASHVGIYVGNSMMIHAGNPIQYASINSNYYRAHFLCFCRLP